jgi:hypothetical protein
MALELSKIGWLSGRHSGGCGVGDISLRLVRSLSRTVFIGSSPNFIKMLLAIISRSSSITSHIAQGMSELRPLNYQKLAG